MLNLEDYSIFELRKIARSCGVKSPTTKKHAELIKEIKIKIQSNEKVIESRKGRPSKKYFLLNDALTGKYVKLDNYIMINKKDYLNILDTIEKLNNLLHNIVDNQDDNLK